MKVITKDLYEASYLLSQGVNLQEVFGDRQTVLFQFEGNDQTLELLKNRYEQGQAQVNVHQLKKQMSHLKDILFTRLRSHRV